VAEVADLTPALVSGPFAQALARDRARMNARYALAQREGAIDAQAFAAHLAGTVDPIVRAVHAARPERVAALVESLYDLSLDLIRRGLVGPRTRVPLVALLWQRVFPAIAVHLADDTRAVALALTNAALQLAAEPGARGEAWLAAMAALAPIAETPQELLDAGKVLAWRAGLAHYRASAIAVWRALRPGLQAWTLGLGEANPDTLAGVATALNQRWWAPGDGRAVPVVAIVARVGGFRGLGGPFAVPPTVTATADAIQVRAGDDSFSLHADRFGATLKRTRGEAPAAPGAPDGPRELALDAGGVVTDLTLGQPTALPRLARATSQAATADTLAVTVPHSYRVFLVARTWAA
jgi:hypothetical protein